MRSRTVVLIGAAVLVVVGAVLAIVFIGRGGGNPTAQPVVGSTTSGSPTAPSSAGVQSSGTPTASATSEPSTSRSDTSPTSSSPPTSTVRPKLTGTAARSFAADLQSGDPVRLAHVLDLPTGQSLDPSVQEEFAGLSPVILDQKTFRSTGPDTATVDAAVGKPASTWTLLLVWRADHWAIAATKQGVPQ